jgi:hypothetical protein
VLHLRDGSAAPAAACAGRCARAAAERGPPGAVRRAGTLAEVRAGGGTRVSKKGGNKTKTPPKAPMANKGPKKK